MLSIETQLSAGAKPQKLCALFNPQEHGCTHRAMTADLVVIASTAGQWHPRTGCPVEAPHLRALLLQCGP
jgi:hypothetical protein